MQGFILLGDALRVMCSSDTAGDFIPFDIEVVTLNEREQTGGRKAFYEKAVLAGAPFGKKDSKKDAGHFLNGTRNIMVPGKGRPVTIHNLLITRLNGERVLV